ncbi:substrate-binding periplasmic protein [Salinimonas marina]|uniref:substrate-binding periplasmic protein n=1 Tax=Salinimonas marina TaxID=2785918 RepID=UPI001E4C4E34|nr:transporter substrate-binding domain-containing protein [Salinimonas marina]
MRVLSFVAVILLVLSPAPTLAESRLGASQLPTYVDDEGEPARLNNLVLEAFKRMGEPLTLEMMRPAFLGSAILSGKLDGDYASIDLNTQKSNMRYSKPYLPLYLYAVSKNDSVKEVALIPHLQDRRVAIDNRFANTDTIRLIKDVKWGRNPSTYDAFKQLADNRAYYLVTSRLLIDEFNRLLRNENEEMVYLSARPLVTAGFRLALREDVDNVDSRLQQFNQTIEIMQQDGSYNRLLGMTWLTKDINGDGSADYISSAQVMHQALAPRVLEHALALDTTSADNSSVYVIDGTTYTTIEAAFEALQSATVGARPSLLDTDIYERILQRW